jgi:hypothetical protein
LKRNEGKRKETIVKGKKNEIKYERGKKVREK